MEFDNGDSGFAEGPRSRPLPSDLPRSLDDRRSTPMPVQEEVYDAWQGTTGYVDRFG